VGDEGGFSAFFEDFVGDLKRIFGEAESDPLQGSSHYQDFNIDDDDEVGKLATPPVSPVPPAAAVLSDPSLDGKAMRKRSKTSSMSMSVFSCCTSPQNLPPLHEGGQYSQLPVSPATKHHQGGGAVDPPAIGVTSTPNRPRMATTDGIPSRRSMRHPSLDDLSLGVRTSLSRRLSFAQGGGAVALSHDELVERVRDSFPDYAENDIKRFSRKCGGSVQRLTEMLRDHLEWRNTVAAPEKLAEAVRVAPSTFIRRLNGLSNDGYPVLYIQGGKFDTRVDVGSYTLLVAKLLIEMFEAGDDGKVMVLVDCRAGKGWANPRADKMIPLIKNISSLLGNHFPDRTHQIVLYPIPGFMKPVWNGISLLLDKKERSKFFVLAGANSQTAKVPKDLKDFVTLAIIPDDMKEFHNGLS